MKVYKKTLLSLCFLLIPIQSSHSIEIKNDSIKVVRSNYNKDSFNYYQKGLQSYSLHTIKDYEESIKLFDKALEISPDFIESLCAKAISQSFLADRIKNSDEKKYYEYIINAEFNAIKAIKETPEISDPHKAMAIVYIFQNKYDKAKEEATKAISLNPNDSDNYLFLWLSDTNRKYDVNIEKALYLNPKSILANYELSNNYTSSFNFQKPFESKNNAMIGYEKSLALNPNFLYSYIGLAKLFFTERKTSEALNNLYKGLEVIDYDNKLLNLISSKYIYENAVSINIPALLSFSELESVYKKALILKPNNKQIIEYLIYLYINNDILKETIPLYKKLIELDPNNYLYKQKLSLTYYKLDDYKLADINNVFKEMKNKDFNTPDFHIELANILSKQGLKNDTVYAYKKAISINPNNPSYYISLINTRYMYNESNYLPYNRNIQDTNKETIELYKKAIKLAPDNDEYYRLFADFLKNNNLYDKAIEEYNKAIKINPNVSLHHIGLGNIYSKQNIKELAIKEYNEVLRLEPTNSEALNNLAELHIKNKEYNLALDIYNKLIKLYSFHYPYYEKLDSLYKQLSINNDVINPILLYKINSYKDSIRNNSNNIEKRHELASYYKNNNLIDESIEEYNHILELEANNIKATTAISELYLIKSQQIKKFSELLKLKSELKNNPKNFKNYIDMANIYLKYNDFENSIKILNKGIELNKDYDDFYSNLSNVYKKKSEFEKSKIKI